MKKVLAFILVAALACSFAGCCFTSHVSGGTEVAGNNWDPIQKATLPVDSDVIEDIVEGVHDAINSKVTRGTVTDNVYTSEYNGLSFTIPSDWYFYSDAEIAETMGLGLDILSDDIAFNEALASLASVYDVMAQGSDGSNLNISYENLTVTGGTGYDEEAYLDVVRNQLAMLSSITYTVEEGYKTVSLSGETFVCLSVQASSNGLTMAQNYYVRRIDNYMCLVVITSLAMDPNEIAGWFI